MRKVNFKGRCEKRVLCKCKSVFKSYDPTLTVPLYMCAGVAYVLKEKGFHSAYQLASECCDSAKKAAKKEKNLHNGLAGNWIDFQICDTTSTQELDFMREKSYVTKDQIHTLRLVLVSGNKGVVLGHSKTKN